MADRTALLRPLSDPGYPLAELAHWVAADAAWRARSGVLGGPLRTETGQMAAVPAFMRLDLQTDRQGPVPVWAPFLGRCWVWTGALTNGYGYVRVGKRKVQAYRVNYERWVGPIPDGLLLDHLCRVRACVRPDHVDPATWSENARRSPIHDSARRAARTRCPAGHEFTADNTYYAPGGSHRYCRRCREGDGPRRPMATATHCAQGHPWPAPRGKNCPVCNRAAGAAFRARQRAEQAT